MSSRFAFAAGILLASLAALPLSAQQSSSGTRRDTSAANAPSARASSTMSAATDSALVDLGRAITELAMSVQKVVDQAKNNPEVRRAALQTASTAVSVAQKTLEENQGEIERLLAEASRKISVMNEDLKEKKTSEPKKH
jgi:hypothetical protein